jgi:hypothetical protein
MNEPLTLFGLPFIGALAYLIIRRLRPVLNDNDHRIFMNIAALRMIMQAPIAGQGLSTFRMKYPTVLAAMFQKPSMQRFIDRDSSISAFSSHRVHNDHLEIIYELGIVGYVLFLGIFVNLSWATAPILSGLVVAFAVDGLFFFPLREAHLSLPFYAALGAMAPVSIAAPMTMDPLIAFVAVLIFGRIMFAVVVKLQGLVFYDMADHIMVPGPIPKTPDERRAMERKQVYLRAAINHDPLNNHYLTEGYYYHLNDNPDYAFQCASKCLEHYSGGKVKWGLFDQYARAVLRLGGFNIARMALRESLMLNPKFTQSANLLQQIDKMEGVKNAV